MMAAPGVPERSRNRVDQSAGANESHHLGDGPLDATYMLHRCDAGDHVKPIAGQSAVFDRGLAIPGFRKCTPNVFTDIQTRDARPRLDEWNTIQTRPASHHQNRQALQIAHKGAALQKKLLTIVHS